MKSLTRLTVLAPAFRREFSALDPTARLPVLERLAARGRCQQVEARDPTFQSLEQWQLDLARILDVQPLPSAPVSALAAELERPNGTWLHAQFIHVAAGLDHLVLVPLRGTQMLDDASLDQLRNTLAQHVREDGYEWLGAGAAHFLYADVPMQIETCAPDIASRLSMVEAMPRGPDGARLRRLMTELQMQLHEHPVNRQRERAGLLPANAVWLWGSGPFLSPPALSQRGRGLGWGQLLTNDNYARGLAQLHNVHRESLPRDGEALLERAAPNTLVLLHSASLTTLDTTWLAPIEQALNRGHIEQLELLLDDVHITADRWSHWRLWRRVRPLSAVIA